METSEQLQPPNTLTLSPADSHAKTSATWESVLDLPAIGRDYGPKCSGSLAKFDQTTFWWRTFQGCLFEEHGEYLPTLPKSGLMRNGILCGLETSERHTNADESSYLPTPTKAMGQRGWGISKSGRARYSQGVISRAFRFGYKPPIRLLEWMMGYPLDFTNLAAEEWETLSRHSLLNGSDAE
tara:strand:- start:127 stop:672 length:546 start_codon:yes stop_codon:yes gene_type:complete